MLCNICKRYIITEKKGKTRIIVLKIKAVSQAFWKLVNKAENTLIKAGMLFIHKICLKPETELLILVLFYRYASDISGLICIFKLNTAAVLIKAVIKHIHYTVAVK